MIKSEKREEIQVIVKSQRYEVPDSTSYSGHWHKEGLTENIKFVALYYFDKDDRLTGLSKLLFFLLTAALRVHDVETIDKL